MNDHEDGFLKLRNSLLWDPKHWKRLGPSTIGFLSYLLSRVDWETGHLVWIDEVHRGILHMSDRTMRRHKAKLAKWKYIDVKQVQHSPLEITVNKWENPDPKSARAANSVHPEKARVANPVPPEKPRAANSVRQGGQIWPSHKETDLIDGVGSSSHTQMADGVSVGTRFSSEVRRSYTDYLISIGKRIAGKPIRDAVGFSRSLRDGESDNEIQAWLDKRAASITEPDPVAELWRIAEETNAKNLEYSDYDFMTHGFDDVKHSARHLHLDDPTIKLAIVAVSNGVKYDRTIRNGLPRLLKKFAAV